MGLVPLEFCRNLNPPISPRWMERLARCPRPQMSGEILVLLNLMLDFQKTSCVNERRDDEVSEVAPASRRTGLSRRTDELEVDRDNVLHDASYDAITIDQKWQQAYTFLTHQISPYWEQNRD